MYRLQLPLCRCSHVIFPSPTLSNNQLYICKCPRVCFWLHYAFFTTPLRLYLAHAVFPCLGNFRLAFYSIASILSSTTQVSAAGTALHVAAVHGHSSVCAALAASPAVNINAGVSPFGHTPLTLACERGHSHVVRVLLGLGADPNPPVLPLSSPSSPSPSSFSGHTPLEAACAGGHTGIARLLLAAGAHITEPCLLSLPSLPSLAPLPTPPPPPTPPRPAGPPLLPLSLPPPIPGDRPSALFASTEHIVPDKDDGGVSGAAPAAPGRFTLSPPRPSPSRPPTMGALCVVCVRYVCGTCLLFWTCPLFCFVGSGVSVEFKFVSWPCDGVQRQEHRETLRGPIIVIGRKQTEVCAVFF